MQAGGRKISPRTTVATNFAGAVDQPINSVGLFYGIVASAMPMWETLCVHVYSSRYCLKSQKIETFLIEPCNYYSYYGYISKCSHISSLFHQYFPNQVLSGILLCNVGVEIRLFDHYKKSLGVILPENESLTILSFLDLLSSLLAKQL